MRLTTWNVNSLRVRLDHVARFVREFDPDVLCLQETKVADDQFPEAELRALRPHLAFWGQPTYNGVAILSKHPLQEVRRGLVGLEDDEPRAISALVEGVRIYGLYVPNGQEVGHPKFHYKLRWLEHLRQELDRYPPDTPLAIVGDFNVAPDDLDVWDPFRFDGLLLCHPEERGALKRVLDWGLSDPYRTKKPFASEFSWWDYQRMGFQRNQGLRIDHTFLSAPLMKRLQKVTIHRDVRGWDQPSDHAPVSVDLA